MKISLILNTLNEGPDVAWTIESFRKHCDCELQALVVADGTTDGSCDNLGDNVLVLKTEQGPYGCGIAKDIGTKWIKGDFVLHADAHSRTLQGEMAELAQIGIDRNAIVSPAIGPLRCVHATKDKKADDIRFCKVLNKPVPKCTLSCEHYEDDLSHVPGNCYQGGEIIADDGGLDLDLTIKRPAENISRVNAVNYSCFGYPRKLLEQFGGWNRYPGRWGMQELGISLRAWFTDTPIYNVRDIVVLHRYRNWDGGACVAPYPLEHESPEINRRYCVRVCFDDETWHGFWRPWFDERRPNTKADEALHDSNVLEQREQFLHLKKRTDAAFWKYLDMPNPLEFKKKPGASKGLFILSGGIGNCLMTIPAQKALRLKTRQPITIWTRGVHRKQVLDVLTIQPWVERILPSEQLPDLQEFAVVAGGWGASYPFLLPRGTQAKKIGTSWRTKHETEIALDAVAHDGVAPDMSLWEIPLNPPADVTLPEEPIAICPGTAGQHFKRYPHWKAVAEILKARGLNLVFLGTETDAEPWMDELGLNLCGKTSLPEAAAVLWRSRYALCVDNGLTHLAATVGTPMVVLYGATEERKNRPLATNCTILSSPLKCAPCYGRAKKFACANRQKPKQPLACMAALEPDRVASVLLRLMGQPVQAFTTPRSLYASRKQLVENRGGKINQHSFEMAQLLETLRHEHPRRILEVGSEYGGWLYTVAGLCGPNATLVAVDPDPNPVFRELQSLLEGQGHKVILVKQTSDEALETVKRDCNGRKFDILHIDGLHGGEFPKRDWDNYMPLVRPGGLVVLHDVIRKKNRRGSDVTVKYLWNDLKRKYDTIELVGRGSVQGIGIVRIPPVDWTRVKDLGRAQPSRVVVGDRTVEAVPSGTDAVPLTDICAVMCNYARPQLARRVVGRLRELGIEEIIVWNNVADPIPEATRNVRSPRNIGPMGKYLGALDTTKPWVLIIDDDKILREKGLDALRRWAPLYPSGLGLQGRIFKPPYDHYRHCSFANSWKMNGRSPVPVDMVYPNRGMLIPTELYRQLPGHWTWGSQQVLSPGIRSTDLAVSCAIHQISGMRPVVVPTDGFGFKDVTDPAPDKALENQPDIWTEKTKELRWLIDHGWKLIGMEVPKKEEAGFPVVVYPKGCKKCRKKAIRKFKQKETAHA